MTPNLSVDVKSSLLRLWTDLNKSNPHFVSATTSGLHSGGHEGTKQNTEDYLEELERSVSTILVSRDLHSQLYYNWVRNRQTHSLRSDAPLTEVAVPLVLGNLRIVYQNSRWPIMQNGCQTFFRNTTLSCRWLPKTLNSINNCKTITDYYTIFNVI